ncbi:hypothetical protein I6F07_30040 [Ensifer sp. IC4062]|nr:hypothetical protein [Ensifer sp. IC4062]
MSELLERTRRMALAAQEHQDLPFEQVVEIVKLPRALDHTLLFQVMLVRQNNSVGSLDLPRLRVEAAGEGLDQVKFDLGLDLREDGEVIAGTFGYLQRSEGRKLTFKSNVVAFVEPATHPHSPAPSSSHD